MHELPKDLAHGLRSFRGSIYGSRAEKEYRDPDVEKGLDTGYNDDDIDRAIDSADRSVVAEHYLANPEKRTSQAYSEQGESIFDPEKQRYWRQAHVRQHSSLQRHSHDSQAVAGAQRSAASPPQTPRKGYNDCASKSDTYDPDATDRPEDTKPLSSEDFYSLLGLRAPSNAQEAEQKPHRLATRGGLYMMIQEETNKIQRQYRLFDLFTYVFLGLQILISAVFIILGALGTTKPTGIAIAVLGAVSTVIGGVLALMKGQGLPNRLRHALDQLRNVTFRAEELWWNFRAGRPVSFHDIKGVRKLYINVLKDMNRNHPDTWTDTTDALASSVRGRKG